MNSRLAFSMLAAATLFSSCLEAVWLRSFIDMKIPPAAREYCHVVVFPSGWKIRSVDDHDQPLMIDYSISDYEFRVEGLLGTWFLVGAFTPAIDHPYYSTSRYRINLSDATARALPASREDWDSATVVPLTRKFLHSTFAGVEPDEIEFNRFKYRKSGASWRIAPTATRLSPDSAWLVLQSVTRSESPLLDKYLIFFDVFDTATGRKLFTLQGTYSGIGDDPYGCIDRAAWLTESSANGNGYTRCVAIAGSRSTLLSFVVEVNEYCCSISSPLRFIDLRGKTSYWEPPACRV